MLSWTPIVVILAGWAWMAWTSDQAYRRDLEMAKHEYVVESKYQTDQTMREVADVFQSMYEQLRTIGRLPGLIGLLDQDIEFRGGGDAFDANTKQTIQEIYNNLATSVDMSEVYIVPASFDPEAIDPATGELQEPKITFDELIIGRTAASEEEGHSEDHEEIEEIEIYEYRVMKRQIDLLRARYPRIDSFEGLDYPAISGPEVVTCDNRYYSPSDPDDASRSGLVYSVPYYDNEGDFAGIVSGVILTHAIRRQLTAGHCLVQNKQHNYAVTPNIKGAWVGRESIWRVAQPDESLIYSEVRELPMNDIDGQWSVWAGLDDAKFWGTRAVGTLRQSAQLRQLGLMVIMLAFFVVIVLIRRNHRALIIKNIELERQVQKQTADLLQVSRQAGMAEVATGVLHNVGNVLNSVNVSAGVIASTMKATRLGSLGKLVALLEEEKDQLGEFVSNDARGQHLPNFLDKLHEALVAEHGTLQSEINQLVQGVEHIKEVVNLQQVSAASHSNVIAPVDVSSLMEQAVTVNLISLDRHEIELVRDYESPLPHIALEKHKTLQILINLISNAKKATCHNSLDNRLITLRICRDQSAGRVVFEITDNGVGIAADQLSQLFQHGFSAFKNGHGFGLHSAVCAAGEMDGDLTAHSDGPGTGATFRLSLPIGNKSEVHKKEEARS